MNLLMVAAGDAQYPTQLQRMLGEEAPKQIAMLGNPKILTLPKTAFFCSARCPGSVILAAHHQAASWRDAGECVIGGFHSPIEKECLEILLRGRQPIIICPARGIEGMRVPRGWNEPLGENRLLLLSGFGRSQKRITKNLAPVRNRIVAALADIVVFAHITPNGKLEKLRQQVLGWKIPTCNLLEM
jgi:predicted Rossmann fold nucleotide-binding protein DprA/Smf involved in DNA uptake